MHSQCPHCQTVFRVSVRHLIAARGMARCGQCGGVFNAQEALTAAPEQEIPRDRRERAAEPSGTTGPQGRGAANTEPVDAEPAATLPVWLQDELQPAKSRKPGPRLRRLLIAAIALLFFTLAAQYVWFEREQLAQYPLIHQQFAAICSVFGCKPPVGRDLDRIEMTARAVATHPVTPGALLVTATLVNQAPFPQPPPLLQLAFTDRQGSISALRRFEPREYLAEKPQGRALLEPGEPAKVRLQIIDPGRDSTAFEFTFFRH